MSDELAKTSEWDTIKSSPGPDLKIFRVRYDLIRNPRNSAEVKAVVLETPDWVDIIAVTPAAKLLVVDQYRFGTRSITTEIPAGAVHPEETPQEAAIRELYEETGYETEEWEYLGWVQPNPAFHNNVCHQFIARNVINTSVSSLDVGESIQVRELTIDEIRTEIDEGKIRNSLALLALSRVCNVWGESLNL
ncbi:MAG: NUDIX hydrolase [Anaerolineales bacterium]|jgi:8-oxo-dGTP pyrophosphatase MutT (NUDIX family)